MQLLLTRYYNSFKYCLGYLDIDGMRYCHTMEDTVRLDDPATPQNEGAKVQDKTAIPAGTYKVIVNMSPRFKKLFPRLLDVPGFDGILIHGGNTEADSSGCILVGDVLAADKKSIHGGSKVSPLLRDKLLLAQAEKKSITITIVNDFGGTCG